MTIVYCVASILWFIRCKLYQDQLITIHYFITSVLLTTLVECAFMWVEWLIYNYNGERFIIFLVFNVILSVTRNTLARIMTLLVSLGYGITL